jgi:hypothetical protein
MSSRNVFLVIGLISPRHTDSLHFYADKKASQIDRQVALVIGVIFAFLLQKGGVAKYEVLIGMLHR